MSWEDIIKFKYYPYPEDEDAEFNRVKVKREGNKSNNGDGVAPYQSDIGDALADIIRDVGLDEFEDTLLVANDGLREKDEFELSKIRKLARLLKEFQEFYDGRESKVFGYDIDSRMKR